MGLRRVEDAWTKQVFVVGRCVKKKCILGDYGFGKCI